MEGRQSRFLGLILGMDPMSMLRASGKIAKPFDNGPHYDHIQYWGGTREVNRYRAVVNVKNVVEMFAFLLVLKTIWREDDIPCLYLGKPVDNYTFQLFADKIERRHDKKMETMRSAAGMAMVVPKEDEKEEGVEITPLPPYVPPSDPPFLNIAGLAENQPTSPASDVFLKRYLMENWYHFRKIGRLIMKNGWYFTETWKSYQEFKKQTKFSDRILSIVNLTQIKGSRYCTRGRRP